MKISTNTLMNHAANLILLLIGMESICVLICRSFELPFTQKEAVFLAAVCLFMWFASGFRYGALVGLPLSILSLFLYFRQSSQPLTGSFHALAAQIVGTYTLHFGGGNTFSAEDISAHAFPAFLLIMVLLSAFVSYSLTSGSFRISLVRIATLPLFFACILVNGTLPVIPAVGCLVFLLGLQLSGDSFRNSDGAGKAFILGIIPCMVVLAGLLLLYRPATYQYDDHDITLSKQFDQIGNLFTDWFGGNGQNAGAGRLSEDGETLQMSQAPAGWFRNDTELKLDTPFDFSALTETAMMIRTSASGTVYLRGRSYGDYTGTSWNAAIDNGHASALNYTARVLSALPDCETYSFEITTPAPYTILYLPYYTITADTGDVSVISGGLINYSGDYYSYPGELTALPSQAELPSDIAEEERQYREYVYSYYTRLPDSTRAELQSICREQSFSKEQADILIRVADYIRSVGIYDLSVSGYPADDYAVSFLTESHRGYCVHFASAAVTLFRCLDIPARICEGYMLNVVPNTDMRVTGENAHAWAEVYLDGTGWIPIEVTASAGSYSAVPDSSSEPFNEGSPLSPDISDTEADFSENETPDAGESPVPDEGNSAADSETEETPENLTKNTARLLRNAVRFLSVPSLFVLLFFLRYFLLCLHRKHRFESADSNKKIVLLYHDAQKLQPYGAEMPDSIRILAEKAAFSQHQIRDEEVDACHQTLLQLSQDTYSSLSKWKRFLYRYFHANYYKK